MNTVYFTFENTENAKRFVAAALDLGATSDDIAVIAKDPSAWESDEHPEDIEKSAETGITTTSPKDAAAGATAGAGAGATIGIIAGLASLLVPGVGLVVGGGALAAAAAGALGAAGAGAIAGGVFGYLHDLGLPAEVTKGFEEDYKANRVIVSVSPREDGLEVENMWTLAAKYGATRTSEMIPETHASEGRLRPMGQSIGQPMDHEMDGIADDPMERPMGRPIAHGLSQPSTPGMGHAVTGPLDDSRDDTLDRPVTGDSYTPRRL